MKPEQKFRAGAVEATIWKNSSTKPGLSGEYYSVSFGKNYKDKLGAWKSTNSLNLTELPKLIAVLGKAYEWCVMKRGESK